jgi:uncharacterized protein YbbC (DUF1343 family)
MTNLKFVYSVVVQSCTHDFQIKYLVQAKPHPSGGKRIQGDQFETHFNKLIN